MENQKTIEDFIDYKKQHNRSRRKHGLSDQTIISYRRDLKYLSKSLNKPFKKATKKDIEKHLSRFSQTHKNNLIPLFQQFYRYLYDLGKHDPLPDCIKDFEVRRIDPDSDIEARERIVTPNEYAVLMDHLRKPIHRAILEAVWVCGGRLSEIHSMKTGGVSFDGRFTRITLYQSKTKPREVSYDGKAEHLLQWHDTLCPYAKQKGKPLWSIPWMGKIQEVNGRYLWDVIDNVCKATGMRHITTHDFRHTVASKLLSEGTPDTFVKMTMGWTKDSQMLKVYDHNKNEDYEEYMRKRNKSTVLPRDILEKQKEELETKHEKQIQSLNDRLKQTEESLKALVDSLIKEEDGREKKR